MEKTINLQRIEEYMQTNGLSKTAFCRRCHISSETYGKILAKKAVPFLAVGKIAKATDMGIGQILL